MKEHIISAEKICKFKQQLYMEEKSEATVAKYTHDIKAFADFLQGSPITKEEAIAYKQYLIDSNYAVRSVNSIIASLNSYFSFVGLLEFKLKSIKVQRQIFCSEDKELSQAEYEKLINVAKQKGNERQHADK